MLQPTKYISLLYFNSRKFGKAICTNSVFNDKRSERERYILEIKKKFQDTRDKKSKGSQFKNSVSNNNDKFIYQRPKFYKKDEFEKLFNRMYFTGDLNCIIDEESQSKIDALLTQRMDHGVKNAVLHSINSNKIPTFKSLLKCSSALSKLGDASTIMYIQNIVKQNYKYLSEKENNLEHYLCEALFRSGNQDKALQNLAVLTENCTNVKRVKETTCFLIRMMPQASEDHQKQAYEIADKFISLRNENKPAAVLLEVAFLSKQNNLKKLAELLLEKYPELLQEREEVVTNIVNKVSLESDHEILQQLIEVLLKYGSKETLSLTFSALLKLYCCLENVPKAKELVSYAKEREIYLKAESVEQFLNLLVKNKQNSSLSALMIKYGLKSQS